jgi:hypothetical protein
MVAGAYWWVQHFYRCSSRELQRIESLRSVLKGKISMLFNREYSNIGQLFYVLLFLP